MTNKEMRTALETIGVKTTSKMKKAELEKLYSEHFTDNTAEFFRVIETEEKHTAQSTFEEKYTNNAEPTIEAEEPTIEAAEEPKKLTFKKKCASVRNFEQLLDTLTAYDLAISYTNRRIVTDAMLFCKRARVLARVYVKNSYETLLDDMLEPYNGYKGFLDVTDDNLDIVIVALQSATYKKHNGVNVVAADKKSR